ncbi:hypothetical protein ACTJNK_29130 [Achromobacter anxifer]
MHDFHIVKQLVGQLLSDRSPEFSARLKQRLANETIAQGLGYFDESVFGYTKFKDFLEKGLADLVEVQRPSNSGDILVSLRHSDSSPSGLNTAPSRAPAFPPIRGEIWQAFINLDPKRRRFLDRKTYAVRHFIRDAASPDRAIVEKNQEDFVEILPISGAMHLGWMKSFLDSVQMSYTAGSEFDNVVSQPYSSHLNAKFASALGALGEVWRRYRADKVAGQVKEWATLHGVPMEALFATPKIGPKEISTPIGSSEVPAIGAKERIVRLLDLLSDDDVNRLVLPTILSTILIKSRC